MPNATPLMTEKDLSHYLSVTPSCLQAWRYRGGGPQFVKFSDRCVRYRRDDVDCWLDDRVCSSTTDTPSDATRNDMKRPP